MLTRGRQVHLMSEKTLILLDLFHLYTPQVIAPVKRPALCNIGEKDFVPAMPHFCMEKNPSSMFIIRHHYEKAAGRKSCSAPSWTNRYKKVGRDMLASQNQ